MLISLLVFGSFFLGHLDITVAEECFIHDTNGNNADGVISAAIRETEAVGNVLLELFRSSGNLEFSNSSEWNQYIRLNDDGNKMTISLAASFGEAQDNGLLQAADINSRITLNCDGTGGRIIFVSFTVTPENTKPPVFNRISPITIDLTETFPIGADFSYLLFNGNEPLFVTDDDYPMKPEGFGGEVLTFSLDRTEDFEILPPLELAILDPLLGKVKHYPRIAKKRQLSPRDSPVNLILVATDYGGLTSSISLNINIVAEDLRDPIFASPYYRTAILSPGFTGDLQVQEGKIFAIDGDDAINERIIYSISDPGGANLSLIEESDGIIVHLNSALDSSLLTKKILIVVIKASQENDPQRSTETVLIVELPEQEPITTGSTTSLLTTSECPTITFPSCPTCEPCQNGLTSTVPTCEPCRNETTVSIPTCEPCQCGAISTAPTCEPCPPSTGTLPSCSPSDCLSVTCPYTLPTNVNTDCPLTCPSATIVTGCPPCTTYSTGVTPAISSTTGITHETSQHPVTCPSVADCNCPTITTKTTITNPPTTSSSPLSGVQFEHHHYSSQIEENLRDIVVVTVTAIADNELPKYSIDRTDFFEINESGTIFTRIGVPRGTYTINAIATIGNGDRDTTSVTVLVVKGFSCDNMHFGSTYYSFSINEKYTGYFGNITLENGLDSNINIYTTDPVEMEDYFIVSNDGALSVTQEIDASNVDHVILYIAADEGQRVTTAVKVKINDLNDPPSFDDSSYPSNMILGYPNRTYIDPAVSMPLFTFRAFDRDKGENASLDYSLNSPQLEGFYINPATGSLYATNIASCQLGCALNITVKDTHGSYDLQPVLIKPLDTTEIHVLYINGSELLNEYEVTKDLTSILKYQVHPLHKKTLSGNVNRAGTKYQYQITVYAGDINGFKKREEFISDMKNHQSEIVKLWDIAIDDTTEPEDYEPVKIISKLVETNTRLTQTNQELNNTNQSLTIASGILGALAGLVILAVVGYFVFRYFRPKNKTIAQGRRDSLILAKRSGLNGHRANISSEEESFAVNNSIDGSVSSTGFGNNGRIQFSEQKVFINDELEKKKSSAVLKTEDEIYCPESPKPKKSIMKESKYNDQDYDEEKDKKKTGVTFNPTPEVISVPATAPDPDDSPKQDDIEVAEL